MIHPLLLVALNELDEREREVLVDRFLVKIPVYTIAERDGVTREAVYAVQKRALRKLAVILAPDKEALMSDPGKWTLLT